MDRARIHHHTMRALKYGARRFSEPSSWAGVSAALAATGIHADPGLVQGCIWVACGLCAILAWALPELKDQD